MGEAVGQGVEIADGGEGGVGVTGINESLDGNGLSLRQVAGIVSGDNQCGADLAAVQEIIGLCGGRQGRIPVEVGVLEEAILQGAAFLGAVLVQHGDPDVLDVERERIAIEHEQHGGHEDEEPQRQRVAPDLPEFLF